MSELDVPAANSVHGSVVRGFEAVRAHFETALRARPGWSAAAAAYVHDDLVVDLWGGPAYRSDSIQFAYSSTKGAASICLALLVERGELDPNELVSHYWPEFAAHGKTRVTVGSLLSHQAGLVAVDVPYTLDDYIAHDPLAERLALQQPYWPPGEGHGYHPLTWGTLADELVRRVTGTPLGALFESELQKPYEIDFFLGLPESHEPRLVFSTNTDQRADDPGDWPNVDLATAALNAGSGFPELANLERLREVRAAALPAVSGIGSARGLAKLYAVSLGSIGERALLTAQTLSTVARTRSHGPDRVLPFVTSFGLGFQTPSPRIPFAGPGSFGHDGFAGSLGFASPRHALAFGFFTDHVPPSTGGADPLTRELTRLLLSSLG